MTKDDKTATLEFMRDKLDLVTKECERLKAENIEFKVILESVQLELNQIDQRTSQLLLNLRERIGPILSRRRT